MAQGTHVRDYSGVLVEQPLLLSTKGSRVHARENSRMDLVALGFGSAGDGGVNKADSN